MSRLSDAQAYHTMAMTRVKNTPEPAGQKFPIGTKVKIAKDLGPRMPHFPSGIQGTVNYVYAHAFGGDNVTSYCLNVEGAGNIAWYEEHQLTEVS